jgi:hypothetical protein
VASLSLATDLGLGQPMEHVLRSCVLGLRIAEDLQLDESERAVVYYVALLAWLGCHADAHEQSARFGGWQGHPGRDCRRGDRAVRPHRPPKTGTGLTSYQ